MKQNDIIALIVATEASEQTDQTDQDTPQRNQYDIEGRSRSQNDKNLLRILVENIRDGFICVVQTYEQKLYRFVRQRTDNIQDTEDIVQETFIRAYNALQEYTCERIGKLNLRPWLYTIAINVTYNYQRSHNIKGHYAHISLELLADNALATSSQIVAIDEADAIFQALRHVSPQYRRCLELQEIRGLSQREIACYLQITPSCVGAYINRGRQQFRRQYQRIAAE